jgi:hypothetical protein
MQPGGGAAVDGLIFALVVAARVLVPLAIPRYPLPTMLAALVIDGLDQTIFQTFTSLDLSGYQNYDKALDVYYLSIAYTATMRNWTHLDAFNVSRFLYFYRLVGVVAFELSQIRALLLVFPNTFEYFFDFYEAVRVRWDPRRMSRRLVIGSAAFIWIVIKLPQEWWIHVAQLDATDTLKTRVFGVPTTASWGEAFAASPGVVVAIVVGLGLLAFGARWLLKNKLPPADRPPTFDADKRQPPVDPRAVERERRRLAARLLDRELVEKIVLVSLVGVIFGRMLPGIETAPLEIAIGVGIVIVANAAISEWLVRRGRVWTTAANRFAVMLAVNLGIVLVGQILVHFLAGAPLEHALVFVLLLTLIVTLYDQYRPIYLARFSTTA